MIESEKDSRTELLKRSWKGPGQCSCLEIARESLRSPDTAPTVCACMQETVDGVQVTADEDSTKDFRSLLDEVSTRSSTLRGIIGSLGNLFQGSKNSGSHVDT